METRQWARVKRTMHGVLVVGRDGELRATLQLALDSEEYNAVGVVNARQAKQALQASAIPLIVLVADGQESSARADALELLEAIGELPPHAYILMSTYPQSSPHVKNPHTRQVVPVLSEPFDLDELLAAIDGAVRRLTVR